VCGNRKFKNKVAQDLERNSLMFGEFKMKQRESDKYLGQVLHEGGLDKSAEATVLERLGRIRGATMEIKSIIEEFPMQAIGGMMAAWELWEKAVVPSLMSGAGTWFGTGDGKTAIDLCDKAQNFYWRVMLGVPESCPKIALRTETGMIGMKWHVWQAKLLLLFRIKSQTGSLCRQVYEEGRANGWPGLWREVSQICEELGIPDINDVYVSKTDIKKAILDHHYVDLKAELGKSTKLESIKDEDFTSVQEYFSDKSVESSRMTFRVRCHMVKDIPGNFKEKYKKKGEDGLICSYCQDRQVMTQSHCMVCPAWEKLRSGLDLTNIRDLATFFSKLLEERARLERESV
jgi:hypothetical protein